jgi:hypothetical protein
LSLSSTTIRALSIVIGHWQESFWTWDTDKSPLAFLTVLIRQPHNFQKHKANHKQWQKQWKNHQPPECLLGECSSLQKHCNAFHQTCHQVAGFAFLLQEEAAAFGSRNMGKEPNEPKEPKTSKSEVAEMDLTPLPGP